MKRTVEEVKEEEHEAEPHDRKVRILLTFLIQTLFIVVWYLIQYLCEMRLPVFYSLTKSMSVLVI